MGVSLLGESLGHKLLSPLKYHIARIKVSQSIDIDFKCKFS